MTNRTKTIISLIVISTILFLYPYTKVVEKYKAEDTNWGIFKQIVRVKKFDSKTLSFYEHAKINEDLKRLENNYITIKGFISKHNHGEETHIFLSETVKDVCFMCNHDEQSFVFLLEPETINEQEFNKLKNDEYIQIKGIFTLNDKNKETLFSLKKAEIVKRNL